MTEFVVVPVPSLPLASSVSDVDDLIGIQAGVTKRFRRGDIVATAPVGESAPLVNSAVIVTGSEEIPVAAGSVIMAAILHGSGPAKIGTTTGAGNIVDEALVSGIAAVYPAIGWHFPTAGILYFTGNFNVTLLFWQP